MMKEYFSYGLQKALKYRANLISWFLADLSLYFSSFFLYYLLIRKNTSFLGLSQKEMLLYVSTYTLVNNVFAIFFSESISHFSKSIENGEIAYHLLYPMSLDKSYDLFHFNLAAFLSTPILLGINLYLTASGSYKVSNILSYYSSIGLSAICLKYLFSFIHTWKMIRIKTEALSGLIFGLLSLGERPAPIFNRTIRIIFTYIVPAFMMSAVPFSILRKPLLIRENLLFLALPFLWSMLYHLLLRIGKKKFQCEF